MLLSVLENYYPFSVVVMARCWYLFLSAVQILNLVLVLSSNVAIWPVSRSFSFHLQVEPPIWIEFVFGAL